MSKSLNQRLQSLNLMAEAIPEYLDILSKVGITEETSEELKDLKSEIEKLNSEQEKLKKELKLKTEELNSKIAKADSFYSENKKLIKIKVDQINWVAFGIDDKR